MSISLLSLLKSALSGKHEVRDTIRRFDLYNELLTWSADGVRQLSVKVVCRDSRRELLCDPAFVIISSYPAEITLLLGEFGHDENYRYVMERNQG